MSFRWRIMGAFVLIIVVTVLLSICSSYQAAQRQLGTLTTEINSNTVNNLAQVLSRAYTESNGWDMLPLALVLVRSGHFFDLDAESFPLDRALVERIREAGDFSDSEPVRVVVVNNRQQVLLDTFFQLERGSDATHLDGEFARIADLNARQPVGGIYFDVDGSSLVEESSQFLENTLYTTVLLGLITAVVALILAVWLSRRIIAPVTALTQATRAIVQSGDAQLLPVNSSDALGQMSASFNQMISALQTQRDLRKRLIGDVSHELNTPLSVIQLEAKGLLDELQTPTDAANNIIDEVEKLGKLVHDLNWLAETDLGEMRLKVESCSVGQLLMTEVKRWQLQAQAQQIVISLQPLPELPKLDLDQMRISQALGNVIQNAIQHTESGGHITIAAILKTEQTVAISVTDDGVGIAQNDLPHVFDRFYRADRSRSRSTGGTGLGLAIARTIIESHNGTIAITSDGPGQGTTVRFELPLP